MAQQSEHSRMSSHHN